MIRLATTDDLACIAKWHAAMNPWAPLPDLGQMVVYTAGRAAAGVKLIGEAWFWYDPSAPSFRRARELAELNAALPELELSAWIPPALEVEFSRALSRLGWAKSPWPTWSRLCVSAAK